MRTKQEATLTSHIFLYGKLLENICHENKGVRKEKGRHWSERAVDLKQKMEEGNPQDELC